MKRRASIGLPLALLAILFLPGASASAKTLPELALLDVGSGGAAVAVSVATIRATQTAGGAGEVREALAISSATPTVCEVLGYVYGPGESEPDREMIAEVRYLTAGTCTFVASVQATSTTEAGEVKQSVTVSNTATETKSSSPRPAITLEAESLTEAFLGEKSPVLVAKSPHPGLSVTSTTVSVCSVTQLTSELSVEVHLISPGTCTLIAALPRSLEYEAADVAKSFSVRAERHAQTITFKSTPPNPADAGGTYDVSASSSSGLPVEILAEGTCSNEAPTPKEDWRLSELSTEVVVEAAKKEGAEPAEKAEPTSPLTLHLREPGKCSIDARVRGDSEYDAASAEQSLTIAPDPSEAIKFVSAVPSHVTVGGSYVPEVRSSGGLPVYFTSATRSVCSIPAGQKSATLKLLAAGACTIDVRQQGVPEADPAEAQQSFRVYASAVAAPKPSIGFSVVGDPSVSLPHKTVSFKISFPRAGNLSWTFTYKGAHGKKEVLGKGSKKVKGTSTTITDKPSGVALAALETAEKHRHGLPVTAMLKFKAGSAPGVIIEVTLEVGS